MAAQVHPASAFPRSLTLTFNDGNRTRKLGTIPLDDAALTDAALVRQIASLIAKAKEEQWKPEKPKE